MTAEFWAIIAVGVTVLVSHFSLHRDMAVLRERMAKIEGAFVALASRVDTLAADVKAVDRRVARLEGWLERDRAEGAPGPSA